MKVAIRLSRREELKALPVLLRHSPGMVLRGRVYVIEQEAATALREAHIRFTCLAREDIMEPATMGKVIVSATIENLEDLFKVDQGVLPPEQVRRVVVEDALVDTGATMLLLPKRLIAELGLRQYRVRQARGLGGMLTLPMYRAVRLSVQGRDCTVDAGEVGDEYPVLIGQVPLELLDWVVDPGGRRLIGNPDHGGEQMIDAF